MWIFHILYGVSGYRNYCRFCSRATDVKKGNAVIAGPKLHWSLWEKSGFPALTLDPFILANNNGPIKNFFSLTVCS